LLTQLSKDRPTRRGLDDGNPLARTKMAGQLTAKATGEIGQQITGIQAASAGAKQRRCRQLRRMRTMSTCCSDARADAVAPADGSKFADFDL
jgi:hypothetical protein